MIMKNHEMMGKGRTESGFNGKNSNDKLCFISYKNKQETVKAK